MPRVRLPVSQLQYLSGLSKESVQDTTAKIQRMPPDVLIELKRSLRGYRREGHPEDKERVLNILLRSM